MRITVHVPDTLGPRVKKTAQDEGVSVSALTAKALEEYIRQRKKKSAGNRLLQLIRPGSVPPEAWEELEKGRVDDRG